MGFCINCDNRHGCKSKTPPCIELMRKENVKDMCGKEYLKSVTKLELCRECDFFYSCWGETEFGKATSSA